MYFKDKIDDIKENHDLKKILFPLIIALLFIFGIILIIIGNRQNRNTAILDTKISLSLYGEKNITIYKGSEYIEPGYKASNSIGEDLTNEVTVNSNINPNAIGSYTITYSLKDIHLERIINVVEKPVGATYIHLMGDLTIYLNSGTEFVEPGYEVIDSVDGGSLKDKVKITDNININKAGIYKRTYTVINSSGITSTKQRTIIVMDSEISLTLDNENYTNQDININIYVNDPYFDYIILPNNTKVSTNKYAYKISENGTYKFLVYNQKNSYKEATITVNNINKTVPNGTCSGEYKNGISTVYINATDDIGISKYVVNGATHTTSPITINGEIESTKVTIYDKAGNKNDISCNLKDSNPIIINGTCSGEYKNGTSTINITASSNRGISKYVINGNSYTTNRITIKGELPSVNITIYDKKNNTKNITCKLEDKNVYGDIKNISTKPPIKKSDNVYLGYYNRYSFWIYFPDKMRANLPVILFMGGLGERGDDYNSGGTTAINLGPIQDVFEFNIKPDAIIIHAQCLGGNYRVYQFLPSYIELLNRIVDEFKANPKKVSVMGFSHGCYGVMNIVASNPRYFSAAVPIGCSPGDASAFKYTPTWAFAGGGDGVGTLPGWVNQINNLGGWAKFTQPPIHEHNVLTLGYSILRDDDYKVIDWMLSQTRS